MDWISFYDFKHSVIYVNARHRDVHYRTIATDIAKLVPSPDARVMDYGCGEATSAAILADACGHLTMVEAAPNVRAALAARNAGNARIAVMTPDEAAAEPAQSYDMIVLHSVAQYLSAAELDGLLARFHRLLKPDGLFVLGDIIQPRLAAPMAAMALLRFGAANGFFWAAVGGLMRIFVSDYLKIKSQVGLSHYEEADMLMKLRDAGYDAKRAPRNIGHNQQRMTFLARPLTGH
ncbi:MAG TPA: class I SAM-dependent methyltransferase [Pseudolabrys sp.]|jgi:SAM-dependent methyltransferase|uniref:class I SAM-dependent methyltransferase n=1 Tax=Pseudolabrys sp. TaxID=1960880 RepID=UPI002DDD1E57|nr:class I SAM-dependent methyltransferase [Pseudolabrys sp.]HEV2629430.1 class I SAM-dependent methyltransferase [Pseudolabrys sp.]